MDSKNPIRIAQVIGESQNGGVEAVIRNYYQYIDKSHYQFDFYVTNTSKIIQKDKIEEMGGRVFLIPHYKTQFFKFKKTLYNAFKQNHYLIVHSNMNTLSCFVLREAKKAGVPIRIAHSHSTSNSKEKLRNFVKNILRKRSKKYATDYFACSEVAGRWLFGDEAFDEGKVTIINNSIDIEKFRFNTKFREQVRAEYDIPFSSIVIGNVGRFVKQKNQSFLISVFKEYHKKNSNSYLLLVGDGPLRKEITAKVKELGLDQSVIFAGVHKHPEGFYSAMDCFVLPSLYEGLPVVGVEAQVNGLPTLISKNVSEETILCDTTKALSLEEGLDTWVNSIMITDFEERSRAFAKFTNGCFDIQHNVKILEKCYEKCLDTINNEKNT